MQIQVIEIERQAGESQCGTLAFTAQEREGVLLWIAEWHGGARVTVEFVPGEGASRADIESNHAALVDTLIQTLFERLNPAAGKARPDARRA